MLIIVVVNFVYFFPLCFISVLNRLFAEPDLVVLRNTGVLCRLLFNLALQLLTNFNLIHPTIYKNLHTRISNLGEPLELVLDTHQFIVDIVCGS